MTHTRTREFIAIAWVLALGATNTAAAEPPDAPPSLGVVGPARFNDGSAELETLRERGRQTIAEASVEGVDERGLHLEANPGGGDAASVPEGLSRDVDSVEANALRGLTFRRGRRVFLAGFGMALAGGILTPAFLFAAAASAKDDDRVAGGIVGALTAVSAGLLVGGIVVAVRGRRMMKDPGKSMAAYSPGRSISFGAGIIAVHF